MVGDNYKTDEFDSLDDAGEVCFNENPADVFLTTGKSVCSEARLKDLAPDDRSKFDKSMAKEWASWQKFGAVEVLSKEQVRQLPEDVQVIGTRWVHTDKNAKPRLLANYLLSKRTRKSKEQIRREFPFEAKIVQGCQDPQNIHSDSPTASLLAFNLVCAVAVMKGWLVTACNASKAYLQSEGISRLLSLKPPTPRPPGIERRAPCTGPSTQGDDGGRSSSRPSEAIIGG